MRDSIHGRCQEETDGFVDVRLERYGREGEFGKGFGNSDDGFELANGDGDGGAGGGGNFSRAYLPTDGDEMRGELFTGFGGEAGRTASVDRIR